MHELCMNLSCSHHPTAFARHLATWSCVLYTTTHTRAHTHIVQDPIKAISWWFIRSIRASAYSLRVARRQTQKWATKVQRSELPRLIWENQHWKESGYSRVYFSKIICDHKATFASRRIFPAPSGLLCFSLLPRAGSRSHASVTTASTAQRLNPRRWAARWPPRWLLHSGWRCRQSRTEDGTLNDLASQSGINTMRYVKKTKKTIDTVWRPWQK